MHAQPPDQQGLELQTGIDWSRQTRITIEKKCALKGQRLKRPDLVSITTDGIGVSQHLIEDISIAGFLDTIGDQHKATTTCVCGGCSAFSNAS